MRYTKSKARCDFEEAIKDKLVCAKNVSRNSSVDYQTKQTVYQSFFFLTSASIENYLQSIFDDWLYLLKSNNECNNKLFINLRTKYILEHQKNHYISYLDNKNEFKVLDDLKIDKNYYEIMIDDNPIPTHFKAKYVLYTNKYPSVKNIRKIFLRIGERDVFNEMNRKGKKDYKNYLESFLSIRENIAHSTPEQLTVRDIKSNYDKIISFIAMLDRILYTKLGYQFWLVP